MLSIYLPTSLSLTYHLSSIYAHKKLSGSVEWTRTGTPSGNEAEAVASLGARLRSQQQEAHLL